MAAKPGIALQLYTVRDDLQKDFVGTLRAVAEMGYPAVQMAGYGGMSATELRRVLDDLNLRVAGSHINLSRLEGDLLDEEIGFNAEMGNRDIILPALPQERRNDWHKAAELLEGIARRCQAQGARFSYHNHAFEFENGGMDILLEETDRSLVYFEPDVYWIEIGGADPVAWIKQNSGRVPLIHIKDAARDAERSFAEVGEGTLDFQTIFAASEAAGAEWYVVEQDRCKGPALDSARISLENLRKWGKL